MVIFPDPLEAEEEEYLCTGGNLQPETLITAYAQGIFPWYAEGDPILWHCPHPRCVLVPDEWRISARSRRKILHSSFEATINTAFSDVIEACSQPRNDGAGTWILPEMKWAYIRLHELGHAQSVEVWRDGALVGGVYGVSLGRVFFGESMFRRANEGSRAALGALISILKRYGFQLLDCQQATPHMLAMGAGEIPRGTFLGILREQINSLRPTQLAGLRGKIALGL